MRCETQEKSIEACVDNDHDNSNHNNNDNIMKESSVEMIAFFSFFNGFTQGTQYDTENEMKCLV